MKDGVDFVASGLLSTFDWGRPGGTAKVPLSAGTADADLAASEDPVFFVRGLR